MRGVGAETGPVTYAMPEAEPWQVAAFGLAVAAILVCGWFVTTGKRPK